MRASFAVLCLVVCASGFAAEAPLVCKDFPVRTGQLPEPVVDLANGGLPLPDYLEASTACRKRSLPAIPPPVPTAASPWLDSERDRYVELLAAQPVDVLVIPFQVQGYGLDRIERAVMTADLAYAIGEVTGLRVADPFHVSLALGEGRRRIDLLSINTLAQKIGARKIVLGYAGHDGQHRFTLTLRTVAPGTGTPEWQHDWRSIAFTDANTPAYVMHDMLPAIVKELPTVPSAGKLPTTPVTAQAASSPSKITLSPLDFVSSSKASTPAVLALLGTMTPEFAELARERLFERALLATLRSNAAGKPESRFLEAYSLLNLQRRPVALARIAGAKTPSLVALRALLDGDLSSARRATGTVKNPFEQFLLQLAVRDLEYDYRKEDEVTDPLAAQALFAEAVVKEWAPMIVVRLDDHYDWTVPDPFLIKQALDDAFPVKEFEVATVADPTNEVDAVMVDLANERHAIHAIKRTPVNACCRSGVQPGKMDLLWALQGMAEARIGRDVKRMANLQGLPGSALDALSRYEPLMKGHPMLSALDAKASADFAVKATDDTRKNWQQRSRERALDALTLAQGQNQIAALSLRAFDSGNSDGTEWVDAYGRDYPHRASWPIWFFGMHLPSGNALRAAQSSEALAFSSNDLSPLLYMAEGADAARATLGSRFTGHYQLKRQAPKLGTPVESRIASLQAAAKQDAEQNRALGYELFYAGRPYEDVQAAFQAYPRFQRGTSRNPVGLTNEAYDVGALLFWQGQGELSKPFFTLAAELDTGSSASMNAEQRLLQLAGDLRGASEASLRRALRYSAGAAFRDHLSLLHAFGEHEAAWDTFEQIRTSSDDTTPWTAALVAHRMQGMDEAGMRAWVKTPEVREAAFKGQRFASYYALMWSSIDRTPAEDLGALVEALEGKPVARVEYGFGVSIPDPQDPLRFRSVDRNFIAPAKDPQEGALPPGRIKSQRAYFADAYSALARGDNAGAVERFIAMSRHYPIEEGAVPYFAYAASKTGDKAAFEKYVDSQAAHAEHDFDLMMAQTFFAAARGKTDDAYRLLELAFRAKPYQFPRSRDVDPHYQFAQACEWLYRDTKDPRFAAKLLEWAKGFQSLQPAMAWPYAVEYQYSKDPQARTRALALAQYLDPASERIRGASKTELELARAWLASKNPFRVKKPGSSQPASTKVAALNNRAEAH